MVALSAVLSLLMWFGPNVFHPEYRDRWSHFLGWHEIASWDREPELQSVTPRYRGVFVRGTVYEPGDVVRALTLNMPTGAEFILMKNGKWYVLQK